MAGPVLCSAIDTSCSSHLLPGGLQSISPNPPTSVPDPIVVVHDAPASQVEFTSKADENYEFAPKHCVAYGNEKYVVGLQMCLAPSSRINGSIIAGKSMTTHLEAPLGTITNLTQQGSSYVQLEHLMGRVETRVLN